MGTFTKGDVIIASLSYSDFSGGKRRPALIVAAPTSLDPVLCLITTKTRGDGFDVRITKADFASGGLNIDSIVSQKSFVPHPQRPDGTKLFWTSIMCGHAICSRLTPK